MEFSDMIDITFKILVAVFVGYVGFVFIFYLFLKSLLKKPGYRFPIISRDSWHFKLTYPLEKYESLVKTSNNSLGTGPIGYSTRLFIMIIIGWPGLIALQTIKMIVYAPILILFGRYPLPNLSLFSFNVLASEVKLFYIPSILIPKISPDPIRLYPIFFVIAFGYGFLGYINPTVTFSITLAIVVIILGIVSVFYLADSGFFKRIGELISFRATDGLSDFIRRHDPDLTLDTEDDEDEII